MLLEELSVMSAFDSWAVGQHHSPGQVLNSRDIAQGLLAREFQILYQPICIPGERGELIGFEALLRWSKAGKNINPELFIGLAETTGQIVELGEYVLTQACKELAIKRAQGYCDLIMSVNVSPRQLHSAEEFVSLVKSQLKIHALPGRNLQLEITENFPLLKGSYESTIRALRGLGVRVVLDDFCCGYMSMGLILELEVDGLKISPVCAQAPTGDYGPRQLAVIESIWLLCQSLGMSLVVEQVEGYAQDAWLKQRKSIAAQGYYYGRPGLLTDYFKA
jgi:EAL domain-containing protein (putative c-di-GMP-specific phosphodiesterase class I)